MTTHARTAVNVHGSAGERRPYIVVVTAGETVTTQIEWDGRVVKALARRLLRENGIDGATAVVTQEETQDEGDVVDVTRYSFAMYRDDDTRKLKIREV